MPGRRARGRWVGWIVQALCLALILPSAGASEGLDPNAYQTVSLAEIGDPPRGVLPPGLGGQIPAGFSEDRVKVQATYTGRHRTSQVDPALVEAWVSARAFKSSVTRAFPVEFEFVDGSTTMWVGVMVLFAPRGDPGTRMELFVHRVGLRGHGSAPLALAARELKAP